MHSQSPQTAGVIARPPVLLATALLVGVGADRLFPLTMGTAAVETVPRSVAAVIGAAGVALFAAAIRGFARAGTPVPTNTPTRALVTTGVHGRTRNPIYLGMFLVYCSIGLAMRGAWTLILAVPLIVTIRYGVVAREEAYLEGRFGAEYRRYRGRVRRWL